MKSTLLFCSTLAIFLAGIAHVSRAQVLLSIKTGVQLNWPTTTTNSYQVQWLSGSGSAWNDLGGLGPGNGATNTFYDFAQGGSRQYRVLEIVPATTPSSAAPTNGGFEIGSGTTASDWTVDTAVGGPVYGVRTNDNPHSGSYNFEVQLASTGAGPVVQFNQAGIPVTAGTNYPLTFYANARSGSAGYNTQWRIVWNTGADTGYQGFTPGINVYASTSNSVVAPAGATSATLYFHFAGAASPSQSATIDMDDVVFGNGASGPGNPAVTNVLQAHIVPIADVTWPTTAGVQYFPESTIDLKTWNTNFAAVNGDGGVGSVLVPLTNNAMFFRVYTPPIVTVAGDIVPLFDAATLLEPDTVSNTPTALVTWIADRPRARHAREGQFMLYDTYLPFYWEQRMTDIQIIDALAKGGTNITFNISTLNELDQPNIRFFFEGQTTVAQYSDNLFAGQADSTLTNWSTTITDNTTYNRPLQVGDRMEFEFSPFMLTATNGQLNYYGGAILYIVGQGIVPWQEGVTNDPSSVNAAIDSTPMPDTGWLAGANTMPYQYSAESNHVFNQMSPDASPLTGQSFVLGRRLHETDFQDGTHAEPGNSVYTQQIGKLGPKYSNVSCVACHVNNGRALPPAIGAPMLQSVVRVGSNVQGAPDPILGSVLQPQDTSGPPEDSVVISSYTTNNGTYGDGTAYQLQKPNYAFSPYTPAVYSVRLAPQLVGLGLLEAISESTVQAQADTDNAGTNGIAGHLQTVTDPQTGQPRLGRFAYKAGRARVSHQIASALNTDMGVTTSIYPILDGDTNSGPVELADSDLANWTRYVSCLGVNARRNLTDPQCLLGEQLFTSANCAQCHVPTLQTSSYHPIAELRNQTIHPYTDLLLHDMGPGLADNLGEGVATGSQWRTAPLWSIGLTAGVSGGEAYLHDGRARSLEEAILWHDGEAAASKEAFLNMSATNRAALVAFLRSL